MKTKYLLEQEKKELFGRLLQDTKKYALRNRAIFYLAKYCGLRVSEVGMLQLTDLDMQTRQIYCRREKGSRDNTLKIIDDDVWYHLTMYLQERSHLFSSVSSNAIFLSQFSKPISRKTLDVIFKNYCKNTNIPSDKWHFHVLKHTRAIELIELGVSLGDIQWWLGHKNINNTQIYAQYTTRLQDNLYAFLQSKQEEKPYNAKESTLFCNFRSGYL